MSQERESMGGAVLVDPLGGLLLDPSNELRFKGPFDDYVTVSLTIRNPTEKRIAFKIKTTAPKRYCVKPNSGVLDPAQSMKVNVLLQPFTYDPNEKNKHKFMVQYLYLNDEEIQLKVNDILNMWKDVNSSRLLDLKLKCIFEFSADEQQKISTNAQSNDLSTMSNTSTYTSLDSTKQPPAKTVEETRPAAPASAQQPASRQSARHIEPAISNPNSNESVVKSSAASTLMTSEKAPNAVSAVRQTDKTDNLSNELKVVQQENEALRKEIAGLKEAEFRLRKLVLSSASSSKQPTETCIADLLKNRLVLIITILVAIILYLLLFR